MSDSLNPTARRLFDKGITAAISEAETYVKTLGGLLKSASLNDRGNAYFEAQQIEALEAITQLSSVLEKEGR